MKIKKFKISPSMLLFIFIIFVVIMGLSMYSSYISQKNATIEMMTHFSQQLSNTIQKATWNTMIGYRLYLNKYNQQLFAELKYLNHLDQNNELTPKKLNQYTASENFFSIYILNRNGEIEFSSTDEPLPNLPESKLERLNKGERITTKFDLVLSANTSAKLFAVGVHRTKGGTIVGCVEGSKVLSVKNRIHVNSLLDSIAADPSIKFVALQDSVSTFHSSINNRLSGLKNDPALNKVYRSHSIHWRISNYQDQKVLEVLNYLRIFKKSKYILRIGLDYSPIQKIQQDALKQATFRLIILVLIGFMMLAYSISMQNLKLIKKEKDKITNEVYDLQANLRQKEKLSVIGELAAGVAHKIRNPLNAISMTMQRLKSEFKVKQDQPEYNSLIKVLRKEINHISKIINQFLEFSKPPSITKSKTNLNKIINNVLELYKGKIEKKEIELNWYPEKEITAQVDGDKIRQCLINLLENAADATSKNGKIYIYLNKNEQNAILKIEDTGKGIKDTDLQKIFNLYFTTKPNGTGIGLAEVYQIIDEHEGKIEVASSPGQGSTFTIELPIKEV